FARRRDGCADEIGVRAARAEQHGSRDEDSLDAPHRRHAPRPRRRPLRVIAVAKAFTCPPRALLGSREPLAPSGTCAFARSLPPLRVWAERASSCPAAITLAAPEDGAPPRPSRATSTLWIYSQPNIRRRSAGCRSSSSRSCRASPSSYRSRAVLI